MKARVFPLAAACLLSVTPQAAGQGQLDQEIASLAGLPSIYPTVTSLPKQGRDAGLSAEALLARLVARLREARIAMLPPADTTAFLAQENTRRPALVLTVQVLEIRGGWTAMLDLSLWQSACITHPPSETGVLCANFRTWSDRRLITSAPSELPAYTLDRLDAQLDLFVMHYLRANAESP